MKRYLTQKGMVIVTGLVFLLVLTLIGISSMSSTGMTEKMSQNLRDFSIAFESSESALSDGEAWIKNQTTVPKAVDSCSTPPCKVWKNNTLGNFTTKADSWWQTQGSPFSSTISGVMAQPQYIIELVSFVPYELSPDAYSKGQGYYYYRVTSRSTGATSTAHSLLQSIYATQYN